MKRGAILLTIMTVFGSLLANADQITTSNGDRMTGTVLSMKNGVVAFRPATSPDATLSIKWTDIRSIVTDEDLRFEIEDQPPFTGKIHEIAADGVHIQRSDNQTTVAFPVAKIKSIVPAKQAEIPPPKPPVAPPPKKSEWTGSLGFSTRMSETSGNASTLYENISANISRKSDFDKGSLRISNSTSSNKTRANGKTTEARTRSLTIGGEYDVYLKNDLYSYAHIEQEIDGIKKISERNTRGFGLGYDIVTTPNTRLSFEAGYSRVTTEYEHGTGLHLERDSTTRLSIEASQKISDVVTIAITSRVYVPPNLSEVIYSRSDGSVNFHITQQWSFSVRAEHRYDDITQNDIPRNETIYSTGISYRF